MGVPAFQGLGNDGDLPDGHLLLDRPPRSPTTTPRRAPTTSVNRGAYCPDCGGACSPDDGSDAPHDGVSRGEVLIRGPWVATEYFGDPHPDRFVDGWLRTGDDGTIDSRGYLEIVDRAKDLIKSGGEWISSVALEEQLLAHPAVAEAAVVAMTHPRWQERPVAFVVGAGDAPSDIEALYADLRERLPRWWIPDHIVVVDALPRTSVGKLTSAPSVSGCRPTHLCGNPQTAQRSRYRWRPPIPNVSGITSRTEGIGHEVQRVLRARDPPTAISAGPTTRCLRKSRSRRNWAFTRCGSPNTMAATTGPCRRRRSPPQPSPSAPNACASASRSAT